MKYNFEVYHKNTMVFHSDSHWLHPIFEFESFIENNSIDPETLKVHDKIIGRAAALLLVRLGIRQIHAGLLSELGKEVLLHFQVKFSFDKLVNQIGCQTETLLKDEDDPQEAYRLIKEHIAKAKSEYMAT